MSCASIKTSDITYLGSKTTTTSQIQEIEAPTLHIFAPKGDKTVLKPVVIFVHGGNWNEGKKELYNLIGRNFAKKDIVAVIPGYTLSPNATYDDMTTQIAAAITWVQEHVKEYGGDVNQIYVSGHSAGGHLAALAVVNPKYGISQNDISGIILNDAAGLDMYSYLQNNPPKSSNNYDTTWTSDPANWKDASPIYFINEETPPFLIYTGTKTYASIEKYNAIFIEELKKYQPEVAPIFLDKKHIPMVTQLFFPWSKRYDEITDFIKKQEVSAN